jgi:hypothetical protein
MSADWMAGQLIRMADGRAMKLEQPRYNPRPPGVIREGSATDAVYQVLHANPKRFFTCGELMNRTKRSHAAVSWALIYLRDVLHVVETTSDSRQGNWLRYRFRLIKE